MHLQNRSLMWVLLRFCPWIVEKAINLFITSLRVSIVSVHRSLLPLTSISSVYPVEVNGWYRLSVGSTSRVYLTVSIPS
jgi:hypothetical protein